jgi:uncharacterized repeat protein (TIGR01451 family)
MFRNLTCLVLLFCALLGGKNSFAQSYPNLSIATQYLRQHQAEWGVKDADLNELLLSSQYVNDYNGVTHLYFQQQHQGIEIFNAISSVHIKEGVVQYVAPRFVADAKAKVNTLKARLEAREALGRASKDLGFEPQGKLVLDEGRSNRLSADIRSGLNQHIPAKLVYWPTPSGSLRLGWHLQVNDPNSADHWLMIVDAYSGEVLQKTNQTIFCTFPDHHHQRKQADCLDEMGLAPMQIQAAPPLLNPFSVNDGSSYNVVAVPNESPIHGARQVVRNPADAQASPFGWHDTNGATGPEFTNTRGNNVHAYLDANADNRPDTIGVANGGANLTFNFPADFNSDPKTFRPAAVTQLFYMNNIMHDFLYFYGFNETGGNYQVNNYGKQGAPNDAVNAEAQDGEDINNANFLPTIDGSPGRMQMFKWAASGASLTVETPQAIAGKYPLRNAQFGPRVGSTPITANAAQGFDATTAANLGCQTLVDPNSNLRGKIVLIDRGSCSFKLKTLNAQRAGAVACLVCNFENTLPPALGNDVTLANPTIPTIGLRSGDCDLIKAALRDRQDVRITLVTPPSVGPDTLDASFDNGIIAHEYGHGVSNRLTGGPATVACLINDEQMGEGWSDFLGLVTTVKPNVQGGLPRGIGNYVLKENTSGFGIRRLPYSTNIRVNNQVYDDIIGTSAPHPLGEVWSTVLWDLYWALSDRYGWDPDLYRGKGGNNIAIRLVMDGMRLQNCNPGFIDGRNAILAADRINNGGANECLIWDVFARRGLGFSANQGSNQDRDDGLQAFDSKPECQKTIKFEKLATPIAKAGDTLSFTLNITNHKDQIVRTVNIADELPTGLTLLNNSVSGALRFTQNAGNLNFELGDLVAGASRTIRYQAVTARNRASARLFFDGFETNGAPNWVKESREGQDTFRLISEGVFQGIGAYQAPNTRNEIDQSIILREPLLVSGQQPVLRFFHQYDTEAAYDAGFIEISTNGGRSWEIVPDSLIFRNGYRGPITYVTFSLANLRGFSGNNGGFQASFVDLSRYRNQQIQVKFRFGTNADASRNLPFRRGWTIDNVEIMDLLNYNGQATLTSASGDRLNARAAGRGTAIEAGQISTSTKDPANALQIAVYPNPTNELLNVQLQKVPAGSLRISLQSPDGRTLQTQQVANSLKDELWAFNLSNLPAGLYMLRIEGSGFVKTEKVVKY